MNDKNKNGFDKIIYDSLTKEEQDFLASLDEEPKFTDQAYGILKGRFRAINWIQTILIYWKAANFGFRRHPGCI